ncbi:hypothetical protein UlMin_040355 [Ulmus minor]
MLTLGVFPLPCSFKYLLSTKGTTSSLLFPYKTQQNHLPLFQNPSPSLLLFPSRSQNGFFLSSLLQFQTAHIAFCDFYGQRCNGLRVSASKKQGNGGIELLEMEGFDDDFGGREGDEDDDGSLILPLENMKMWMENKPRGFGEGKVYDTAIEDKLMEELEQSREAQAANLNKLKNSTIKPESKLGEENKKATEVTPSAFRVRVVNLPKKKNIHRDLSLAFKGVSGLISICPVVSGNKKTREPICKGFAFVYFKSEEDATRFAQMFSRRSITFGKLQKQIKCEMMNSGKSDSNVESSADKIAYAVPQLTVHGLEAEQSADSNLDDSSMDELENVSMEDEDLDDEFNMLELEDLSENDSDGFEQRTESESMIDSPPMESDKIRAVDEKLLAEEVKIPKKKLPVKAKEGKVRKKKLVAKRKEVKVPKLSIPGSAKRLRVKEKAVLTDVFSKYGLKSALVSNEES